MEKTDLLLILYRFESIRNQAERILVEIDEWCKVLVNTPPIRTVVHAHIRGNISAKIIEAKNIIMEYSEACSTAKKTHMLPIFLSDKATQGEIRGSLRRVVIRCDSVVGMIRDSVAPISSEEADRLQSLREQLRKISLSIDLTEIEFIDRNIQEAMKEYERGAFLASALITSRVIMWVLDQIEGKTVQEKVELLIEKEIIPKKREDISTFILKACHKARNYLSHDIKIFPQSSDAISLLGDCIGLFQFFLKLRTKIE